MKPRSVLGMELLSACSGRRVLIARIGLPFLLALPFIMAAMPYRVKLSGLAILLLFVSFFGAAVGHVRHRSEGLLVRLDRLPMPRSLVLVDLLLAGTAVDLMQAGPIVLAFAAVNADALNVVALAHGLVVVCGVLLFMNLLGVLVACAARSNQDVHLFAALAAGGLIFLSGLVPVPPRIQAWVGWLSCFNPLAWLAQALAHMVSPPQTMQSETVWCLLLAGGLALGFAIRTAAVKRVAGRNRLHRHPIME